MKKHYIYASTALLLLVVFFHNHSYAQLRVGPSLGINVGTINFSESAKDELGLDNSAKTSPILRMQLGVIGEYGLSDEFTLRSGLLLSHKGTSIKEDGSYGQYNYSVKQKFKFNYIEVPLLGMYEVYSDGDFQLNLLGGFSIAIASKAEIESKGTLEGPEGSEKTSDTESLNIGNGNDDEIKGGDLGFMLGATLEFDEWPVQLGITYNLGLGNVLSNPEDDYALKNRTLSITAAYLFGIN